MNNLCFVIRAHFTGALWGISLSPHPVLSLSLLNVASCLPLTFVFHFVFIFSSSPPFTEPNVLFGFVCLAVCVCVQCDVSIVCVCVW